MELLIGLICLGIAIFLLSFHKTIYRRILKSRRLTIVTRVLGVMLAFGGMLAAHAVAAGQITFPLV